MSSQRSRTQLSRKTSQKRVVTPANLNARIHRILNKSTELKVNYYNTSIAFQNATAGGLFYFNPFSNIVQGTQFGQRIGDSIYIEKIVLNVRYVPDFQTATYSGDLDTAIRVAVICLADNTYTNSTMTNLTMPDFVYGGGPAQGPINTNDHQLVADRTYFHRGVPLTTGFGAVPGGFGYKFSQFSLIKSFPGKGKVIKYQSGSNTQAVKNCIVVCAADQLGYLIGGSQALIEVGVTTYYRDT